MAKMLNGRRSPDARLHEKHARTLEHADLGVDGVARRVALAPTGRGGAVCAFGEKSEGVRFQTSKATRPAIAGRIKEDHA